MSEKKRLLTAFLRAEVDAGNIDFRHSLSTLAESVLEKSRLEADAFADANLKKYWNWLAKEIDSHAIRGLVPFFSLAKGGGYSMSSVSHDLLSSSCDAERFMGTLALSRPAVLRQMDSMTDREYEALACVACSTLGSAKTQLTPPGNEGGIDFFAILSVNNTSHIFSSSGTEIRIVGQCKKYISPVSVDKLEQFITTLQNVRHRSERVRRHIPTWFDESRGPIVGWMMAHSGFQTGASDEAKNHGIILSDTLDLAEVFCLSESFHSDLAPVERARNLVNACRALI